MDKVAPGNGVTVEYLDMSTSDETAIRTALKPETKVRPCSFYLEIQFANAILTAVGLG